MNAEQCAIVQRLITELDDTHYLYLRLKPLLSHTHARYLLTRMIELHSAIADDLAQQMRLTGGLAARRGGGAWARLRARAVCWMAISSADSELACLERIVRHEDRMAKRFQAAMAQVSELHQCLDDPLLATERTGYRIESLMRLMEASSPGAPRPVAMVAALPERRRPRT